MSAEVQVSATPSAERGGVTTARRWEIGPELWIVLAATAIGALLRFDSLAKQSYWVDEATTVHEIGLSFGAMLHAVAHNEATPPLYFAIAWIWSRIFSPGEVGLRSLSAVCGTLTIPVVYLCGRQLISRWAGAVAAGLTAFSPFMLWYSQEARAYIMLALFCGLSLLFCARARQTGRGSDLVLWTVVSAAALATHFFAVLLVIPEGVWLTWRLRRPAAAVALAVVAAVQGALMPLLITDAGHPLDGWIGGLPLHGRIQGIPVDFGASQLYKTSALSWGLWGAGLVAAALVLLAWRSSPSHRRGLALTAGLALIIIGLPVVGAVFGTDYLFSRNLTPAWIPLVVLVGGAACAERARVLGVLLIAAISALFIWADVRISSDGAVQRPDWRAAAAALGPATVPRAILIYDGNIAEEPLSLYLAGTTFSYSGAPPAGPRLALSQIDVVSEDTYVPAAHLPAGVRLIAAPQIVGAGIEVSRFALSAPRELTPAEAVSLFNGQLVTPASLTPSVLVQR